MTGPVGLSAAGVTVKFTVTGFPTSAVFSGRVFPSYVELVEMMVVVVGMLAGATPVPERGTLCSKYDPLALLAAIGVVQEIQELSRRHCSRSSRIELHPIRAVVIWGFIWA